jgi:ATP-dependent Clp protease ATP-binding subunit ClpC
MSFIAPEHIAVACSLLDDVTLVAFFQSIGVDRTVLRTEARRRLDLERERERGIDKKAQTNSPAGPRTDTKSQQQGTALARQTHNQKQRNSPLASFCVDLTEKARAGTVDPVIGRETEVERVVQILARRSKNNPILLGEPGVGKTAIAEGLALRIARGDVPDFLAHKKVVSLDVGLLMAGAKERGELEQRVTGLVEEIKQVRPPGLSKIQRPPFAAPT